MKWGYMHLIFAWFSICSSLFIYFYSACLCSVPPYTFLWVSYWVVQGLRWSIWVCWMLVWSSLLSWVSETSRFLGFLGPCTRMNGNLMLQSFKRLWYYVVWSLGGCKSFNPIRILQFKEYFVESVTNSWWKWKWLKESCWLLSPFI